MVLWSCWLRLSTGTKRVAQHGELKSRNGVRDVDVGGGGTMMAVMLASGVQNGK